MKRILISLILILVLVIPSAAVLASDLTDADFYGTIIITNEGTANTCISTNLTLSTTAMIDAGYIDSECENVAIHDNTGADARFMPGYDTNPWIIWVSSITGSLSITYPLYTGNTSLDSTKYYFPGSGGMTVSDDATLECGDNFTLTVDGYIDVTQVGDNITSKDDALRTYISGSGNITSAILLDAFSNPTGHDDPESAWANETNAYDDNLGTYATDASVAQGAWSEYIEFTTDYTAICSAQVYYASVHFTQTDMDVYHDGAWHDYYEGATSQGSYQELAGGLVIGISNTRVRFYNGGAAGAQDIPLAEFDVKGALSATVPSVSSGEYEVTVGANSSIYGTLVDYGDVLHFNGGATNVVNCGQLHDSESKLWVFLRFELDDDFDNTSATRQDIFHKWVDGSNYIRLQLDNSDGRLRFYQVLGGVTGCSLVSTTTTWNSGQVYSILASITDTASGIQRLLVDSSLEDSDTTANLTLPASGDVLLGFSAFDSSMIIHTVVIGTDDLTSQEEQNLFDGIIPADANNIWHLDEGTGLTATDRGVDGDDGTIGAGCTWESGQRYTDFYIDVDGTSAGTNLYSDSVPNNANDWHFFEGDALRYMEYAEITVDGTQAGYWEWEYNTTFTDNSGNGNTATPTFQTGLDDVDITATLTSFEAIDLATAPSFTVESASDFLTSSPTFTDNFTSGNVTVIEPPGFAVIEQVAEDSDTPNIWIWGIMAMFSIAISGVGLSYARKKFGISGGYVLVCIAIGVIVFSLLIAFDVFDWWMLWLYLIIAGGVGIASRHIDWGGATSQHSLVGFLAMAFIGLTLINRILEGSFITSSETEFLNTVAFTQTFDIAGVFSIPILNFSFFTEGIPALLRWDYSFFGGQAQILQYLLYSITAVVSFIIFTLILGLVYNYFSRLR